MPSTQKGAALEQLRSSMQRAVLVHVDDESAAATVAHRAAARRSNEMRGRMPR
jgi:hypothetical protein